MVTTRTGDAAVAERLYPPMPSFGWRGWLGPIIVTVIAAVIRLVNLGRPNAVSFDETYYPKDAWALLRFGVEHKAVENHKDLMLSAGDNWRTVEAFTSEGSFVVHPPFGKWTIAAGEYLFGVSPFGWRIAVAILGVLTVLLVARIVRRITRSDLIGTLAGFLLALDGIHIVMSRTGLLDGILTFWVVVAFGLLVLDRDRTRARLASFVTTFGLAATATRWGPNLGVGPFGIRPLRLAAAVALGLACSVKWSGLWFLALFALMSVVWDVSARRAVGTERPWAATLLRDAPIAALTMIPIALAVYLLSWTGWLVTDTGWGRQWADEHPDSIIPAGLRSLWHYHDEAWNFHVNLDTEHSYSSNALSWPFMARPTSFFYEGGDDITSGCEVDKCSAQVTALGNPIIWWAALLALPYQLWRWVAKRDWRSGAVLVGVLAGWGPWLLYLDRTIFTFYTVVYAPFVMMAVAMTLGDVLGPADASPRRRQTGIAVVAGFLVLVIAAAWWFYPIWTGQVIPYDQWRLRMWFQSWV